MDGVCKGLKVVIIYMGKREKLIKFQFLFMAVSQSKGAY
jgi:hypothetical protein